MEQLIQIADAALADSYARAGGWMACRPGCDPCCHGVFPINVLDVKRLRTGLFQADPVTAAGIQRRAAEARIRLSATFPGDAETGELFAAASPEVRERHEVAFEEWANDEPCPVLDPVTRTCSLYEFRPVPCRTFGPPMPNQEAGLAICELCFRGASEEDIAASAVDPRFLELEESLVEATGDERMTIIAFALK